MARQKKQKVEEKVEEYKGEMGTYKVLKEFPFTDEKGESIGNVEVGSVQRFPIEICEPLVEDGFLERGLDIGHNDEKTVTNKEENLPTETTPNKTHYHNGVLINTSIDHVVHHNLPFKKFSTVNKESYMLSPKEFDEQVKSIEE